MRVLAAPGLPTKLDALSERSRAEFGAILHSVTSAEDKIGVLDALGARVSSLDEGIYTVRAGPHDRLIIAFGEDEDGAYVLLLDAIAFDRTKEPIQTQTSRDPRYNKALDPRVNRTLDPRINRTLDPRINRTLDPRINRTLDPRINRTLDPRINRTLDPRINRTLDPRINRSLDPRINRTLDPGWNRAFGGPFLYDQSAQQDGFLVRAADSTFLIFDSSLRWIGYAHATDEARYLRFDVHGNWNEFWTKASDEVWLRFTPSADWVGTLIMD
jgi:hypothetical protein